MKLIIDIDEETYSGINDLQILAKYIDNTINAIRDGTPLQAELEEIKAEIIKKSDFGLGVGRYIGVEDTNEMFDKYIKEIDNGR